MKTTTITELDILNAAPQKLAEFLTLVGQACLVFNRLIEYPLLNLDGESCVGVERIDMKDGRWKFTLSLYGKQEIWYETGDCMACTKKAFEHVRNSIASFFLKQVYPDRNIELIEGLVVFVGHNVEQLAEANGWRCYMLNESQHPDNLVEMGKDIVARFKENGKQRIIKVNSPDLLQSINLHAMDMDVYDKVQFILMEGDKAVDVGKDTDKLFDTFTSSFDKLQALRTKLLQENKYKRNPDREKEDNMDGQEQM